MLNVITTCKHLHGSFYHKSLDVIINNAELSCLILKVTMVCMKYLWDAISASKHIPGIFLSPCFLVDQWIRIDHRIINIAFRPLLVLEYIIWYEDEPDYIKNILFRVARYHMRTRTAGSPKSGTRYVGCYHRSRAFGKTLCWQPLFYLLFNV